MRANHSRPEQGAANGAPPAAPPVAAAPVAAPQVRNGPPLIRLVDVVKAYQTPAGQFMALRGINLEIGRGEFVAVVGKSGSGKSTLINMITGIDRPTSGAIYIGDTAIHELREGPMAEWRGRNVGVIFQFNMYKSSEREKRALNLLGQVDMEDQAYKLPSEVSGGQQQRAAIARALANDPPLLVADEPTGNLDSRTADAVFQLFERMVSQGKTILMVTHDEELAKRVTRRIIIADGEVVHQEYRQPAGFASASPQPDPNSTVELEAVSLPT
jgi:putative ABC transport system ATP-binding protein